MSDSSSSFWKEGPERLREALTQRHSRLNALYLRLLTASSDEERAEVEQEIRMLEKYQPSDDQIEDCLF